MEVKKDVPDANLQMKVLSAITGALREEKVPLTVRLGKIIFCSIALSLVLGSVFYELFHSQLDLTWQLTGCAWFLYFIAGFALLFKPQARLTLSNVWSPFVIARLFLVSTLATILQIIICPSFVFLDSPIAWNPLLPMTNLLMRTGGMELCMGFCGLLFTAVAGGLGLFSIRKSARTPGLRNFGMLCLILSISQFPVLLVQVFSTDLRPYSAYWICGVILGYLCIFATHALMKNIFANPEAQMQG